MYRLSRITVRITVDHGEMSSYEVTEKEGKEVTADELLRFLRVGVDGDNGEIA